ncbi:unnamed protein product [Blepharisma stoltei]|uniref:Uncharacterized protein n=1 Tax=Blepharisma stoltei TaxID=1481888 RepID=A0AAU9JGN9_9CILI|nr:unnamed protein product [Blepharisma stoltei]
MNCIIPKSLKKLVSEAQSSSHLNANRSRLSFVGKPYLNSLRASNLSQNKPGIYRSRTSSCVCALQALGEAISRPKSTNRKNQRSSSEKVLKPILKKEEEKCLPNERKVQLTVIFPNLCEKEIQCYLIFRNCFK